MRVLMLSQFYPPLIGGEERYVRDLSMDLAGRGHQVSVATLHQSGLADLEIDRGVRVHRLRGTLQRATWLFSDVNHTHVPPFPDPELVAALRRLVVEARPDIVHAHNWLVSSFLPLKTWSRAPLVVTLHDCSRVCPKKSFMYAQTACSGPGIVKCLGCATHHYGPLKGIPTTVGTWRMRAAERRLVDMFLPVSQAVAEVNGLCQDRVPFQVIPNFVPDNSNGDAGDTIDAYVDRLPREDYLLFVGGGRYKGADVLLRAYAGLEDPPPLVLIGPEHDAMGQTPARVHLFQNWPHAAVMAAWRRSLIGLAPSTCMDACPTVIIEAMTAGCAVIASRIGGARDLVVEGETGLLVPPGDADALRAAIERLLADGQLRRQMGQSAQQRVRQFRASAVVPRIERIYQQLVAA